MEKVKFNDAWKVWKENNPFGLIFKVPEDAKEVTLPYDAMLHEAQTENSINGRSTGFIDGAVYKYYKQFFVPEEYKGQRIWFRFEGVYRNASVFINQSQAGSNTYGYTDFMVQAEDYLKYGEMNEMLVVVKCGVQNSRWYTGAGIYCDVHMIRSGSVYMPEQEIRITTKEVEADGAIVNIAANIHNDSLQVRMLQLTLTLVDGEGKTAVCNTYPVRVKSRDNVNFRKDVYVEEALMWDDITPNLYTVTISLCEGENILDQEQVVAGIRKLTVDSRHGLRVNGREVKLRGGCIHHDQGFLGAAIYDDFEYRRIKRMKEAGFNAIRSAHNPATQALLRACDKLGVYVMDELTDVWEKHKSNFDYSMDFDRSWEKDMECMVAADYNHPSVIMYSTGNEVFDLCTDRGIEVSKFMYDKFHQLDDTRPVTNGMQGLFMAGNNFITIAKDITKNRVGGGDGDVNNFMGVLAHDMGAFVEHPIITKAIDNVEYTMDIMGYNYMTSRYLKDAEKYKDRVMVGTETYPQQISENWDVIMSSPAVIGDFTWTGWDFLGEVSPVYPKLYNVVGDIDLTGNRRPVSYFREIVFGLTQTPCIAVQDPAEYGQPTKQGKWFFTECTFNYTYPGKEGQPIVIEVYSGGDSVELIQNGKSLGIQPCGKETRHETQYHTVYEPGELIAIAYKDGQEIGRRSLCSAGEPAALQVDVEKYEELIFVNIEVVDSEGRLVSHKDIPLRIQAEGAQLLAFGSMHGQHKCGFELPENMSGEGHALAILKGDKSASDIQVTISGEGVTEYIVKL